MAKLTITCNAGDVGKELKKVGGRVPKLTKEGLSAAVEWLFAYSKRTLTKLIYQKDIPKVTRTRGKFKGQRVLAWRRKMNNGGLLGSETYSIKSDGTSGTIETRPGSPAAKYSLFRHALNRPSPIDGKTRYAPWRLVTNQEGVAESLRKFREALDID